MRGYVAKFFSKIAYDSKDGSSRIDCARKVSSILGHNCPEFRVATFPFSSDRYFLPSSLPYTPYFSSNVIPPTPLLISATPLYPSRARGGLYHISHLPPKTVRFNPQPKKVRYIAKCVSFCCCVFVYVTFTAL